MSCYGEHDYVYVARSSENDNYDINGFWEYCICIGCGKKAELVYEPGTVYELP